MWIYDGEEWTEIGGSENSRTTKPAVPRYDESMPELQVIEQLPVIADRHVIEQTIEQVSPKWPQRPGYGRVSRDH